MAKRKKVDLKSNLDFASVNYDLTDPEIIDETGIHPISRIDADIIYVLCEIIRKLDDDDEMLGIIERYKSNSDDDTYDLLVSFYESMPDRTRNIKYYIEIGDNISLNVAALYSFTREESYENGRLVYQIIVNKTQDLKTPYANTTVSFATEDFRDAEFIKLKEKLRKFSNVMFI